jgi:hypothetical protein
MGAVPQQRVQDVWQHLAFFSRKLSLAQQKCSIYDWEFLAIYEEVRHFHHMLEARLFNILTYHKPVTYAFHKKKAPVQITIFYFTIHDGYPPHV